MGNQGSFSLKVILINLSLIIVLLIASFLMIEWGLRLHIPDTDHTGMNELAPAPLYYRIKPNFSGILEGVKVDINSDGFRDNEFMKQRPEKQKLIAILGDSIAFGQGVPQDQTFPAILEKLLNVPPVDMNYTVWNLGVPGYNTQQEYQVLQSLVLPANPNWVFLAYVINDVEPVNKEALKLIAGEKPDRSRSWFSQQLDKSITLEIARNRMGRILRWFKPDWRFSSYVDDAIAMYAGPGGPWSDVSNIIESMKIDCDRKNIRFTLVMTPAMMDFSNYPFRKINQTVERFCEEKGIDYLDVLPYFRNYDPQKLAVSIIDSHPNAQAQAIIASAVADHINKPYRQ